MYISPKRTNKTDAWKDPIINLDKYSFIQANQQYNGVPSIQFLSPGGEQWVSWIYTDADDRDKEMKRIENLTKWPRWFSGLAILCGY